MKKLVAVLNLVPLVWMLYMWSQYPSTTPAMTVLSIMALFLLNFAVLWLSSTSTPKTRLGRMLGYWLDGKEAELKAKASGTSSGAS